MSKSGIVLDGHDAQILGQRQLPVAQQGVGQREQFPRLARLLIGDVPLAAQGQQQGMDAGRFHGVDRPHAGNHSRNYRAGQLVDELAEHRVFLRRATHHGERPDGVGAMIDALHQHHGKLVRQAVVAQVIAEGAFGQLPCGIEMPDNAEIGLGVDGQLIIAADHRHAAPAQHAGEGQLAGAFGQRHDGGQGHGRRPAHEDIHPQSLLATDSGGMMGGDAALELIVQPHLAVADVLAAGKLHAVHAQV